MPLSTSDAADSAHIKGAHFARNGWSDCDSAAAHWLSSGEESAAACVAVLGAAAAEAAFVRGYRAERSKPRRGP
jgi:hypothetical protein